MAVTGTTEANFNFVGGLNTEGGFFLTPKNSWVEGTNIVPQIDGSAKVRKAIELEPGVAFDCPTTSTFPYADSSYIMHKWENVGGLGFSVFVVQMQDYLYFFKADKPITSANKYDFFIWLGAPTYRVPYGNVFDKNSFVQVAEFYGKLVVTHKSINPLVISYDLNATDEAERFYVGSVNLLIRDFFGMPTGQADSVEKTQAEWALLNKEKSVLYNLFNQGWKGQQISSYASANSNKLPSNTKQWIFGKDTNDDFSAAFLNKQDFGSSPAPKGRNIIDAFYQERSYPNAYLTDTGTYAYGVPAVPIDENGDTIAEAIQKLLSNKFGTPSWYLVGTESASGLFTNISKTRPSSCAVFAGRVWYAGAEDEFSKGYVLYSQVTDDVSKIGNCYQKNDPTAEVISDLVDDDGGLVVLQDAGTILKLQTIGNALLVFATNGVWSIYGGDAGFKATSYIVDKVSSVGALNAECIVPVENTVFYWSEEGIYNVIVDSTGLSQSKNVSNDKIKTLYNNIPFLTKKKCQGVYDKVNKTVYWLYGTETTRPSYKDTVLTADLQIGNWYTLTFPKSNGYKVPTIVSFQFTTSLSDTEETLDVVVNGEEVLSSSNPVVVTQEVAANSLPMLKFLVLYSNPDTLLNWFSSFPFDIFKATFADLQTTTILEEVSYTDFSTYSPNANVLSKANTYENYAIEYPRKYIVTAYVLGNNGPHKKKSVVYLHAFLKRTETGLDELGQEINPSSCLLQTRWDYTDNTLTGKWSSDIELYRYNRVFLAQIESNLTTGYPLIITKNKIRGFGKALQMKFEAPENKQMHIYGWSMDLIGNANV